MPRTVGSYGRHGNFDYASTHFISHVGNSIVWMPSRPVSLPSCSWVMLSRNCFAVVLQRFASR